MTHVWIVEMSSGAFGTFWPKAAFGTEEKAREWAAEWQKDADEKGNRERYRVHGEVRLDPTGWVS